jgi:hypothetical protein
VIVESCLDEPKGRTANHHEKSASRSEVFCRRHSGDLFHRRPRSGGVPRPCTDPRAIGGRVDRYYDPATDQFLSVDPDVAETDQPYAFTGDDPLNATDPTGDIRVCDQGCNITTNNGPSVPNPPQNVEEVVGTTHGSESLTFHTAPITIPTGTPVTIMIQANATISGPDPIGLGVEQDGTLDFSDAGLVGGSISPDGAITAAGKNLTLNDGFGYSANHTYQFGSDTVTVGITASYKINRMFGGAGAGAAGFAAVGADAGAEVGEGLIDLFSSSPADAAIELLFLPVGG